MGRGAHGEYVANDSTDARCCALIGFNKGRMVMRLDLEHRSQAVPDVDYPGILARSLDDLGALSGQSFEVNPGTLVATMFRPHHRKDPQLSQVRSSSQTLANLVVLFGSQAVIGNELGRDFHVSAHLHREC